MTSRARKASVIVLAECDPQDVEGRLPAWTNSYRHRYARFSTCTKATEYLSRVIDPSSPSKIDHIVELPVTEALVNLPMNAERVMFLPTIAMAELQQAGWPSFGLRGPNAIQIDFDLQRDDPEELGRVIHQAGGRDNAIVRTTRPTRAAEVAKHLSNLTKLMDALVDVNPDRIQLSPPVFLRTHLLHHPCNAYSCKSSSCHSGKSDWPSVLYLTQANELLPEDPNSSPRMNLWNKELNGSTNEIAPEGLAAFHEGMRWLFRRFVVESEHPVMRLGELLPFIDDIKGQME
ncbi:MAG: hypothetical protein GY930_09910 [bacterium]|nr:hypothetical protein [bacterium]